MDGIVSRAGRSVKGLDRVSGGLAALDTPFGSAMLGYPGNVIGGKQELSGRC